MSSPDFPPSKENLPSRPSKFFYGWVVAIAGAIIILATGNFQYTFGVFLKPILNEFQWSRTAISGVVTIRSLISGAISPLTGALSDKYGPKKLILASVFFVGLGYVLAYFASNLLMMYIFLGLFMGIGIGSSVAPVFGTVTKWFGSKSGMANGIAMSGFSTAQMILPPIATLLILRYNWHMTFLIMGMSIWVLGMLAWGFLKSPPQIAATYTASTSKSIDTHIRETGRNTKIDGYTLKEALHTPGMWIMLTIYMLVAASYQMAAVHIVASAIDAKINPEAAAIILTLSGVTNTMGRLGMGALAGWIGNKAALAFCTAIQVPALIVLAGASELHVFYIVAAVQGLGYGGVSPVMPTMAANFFGTKSSGSIFGTLNLAFTIGGAAGPLFAGYIFDITGSYSNAFFAAAAGLTASFILSLIVRAPAKRTLANILSQIR